MAPAHANPPPSEQHVVQLEGTTESKITGVSVYPDRAEVTRSLRVSVKTGQNHVVVSGLTRTMNQDSLRVEGNGTGSIQDVTISQAKPSVGTGTSSEAKPSAELKKLQSDQTAIEHAIYRNTQAQESLNKFLGSLSSQPTPSAQWAGIINDYDTSLGDLQKKKDALLAELEDVKKAIVAENWKVHAAAGEKKPLWNTFTAPLNVTVSILAHTDEDIELRLIYAVSNTSWFPRYDIRVNTQAQTKERVVSLIYRASIRQSSGEDWTDVPITLETATASFDRKPPELGPWRIGTRPPAFAGFGGSPFKPPPSVGLFGQSSSGAAPAAPQSVGLFGQSSSGAAPAPPHPGGLFGMTATSPSGGAFGQPPVSTFSHAAGAPPPSSMIPHMRVETSFVTSKGGVSVTFTVPGFITIPSDGADHGVTIATLELDAKVTWVSIPKKDTNTYLSAKIKNASEYTLLSGTANVFVNGSFISRSPVPFVSPEETFECALGLDPAIRITYHPLSKKLSQSGLLSKSSVYLYTQRITVHNTKKSPIETVKIVDQIPASEDDAVKVKLLSPALQYLSSNAVLSESGTSGLSFGSFGASTSSNSSESNEKILNAIAESVNISSGIVAQWDRPGSEAASSTESSLDSEPVDLTALGKDGKINWLCSIPSQTKVNLTLQWEVSAPVNTRITGI